MLASRAARLPQRASRGLAPTTDACGRDRCRRPASCTSVSNWLTISPPIIVMPSGRRSSDPMPVPKRERQGPEQRRHGGHQDGTETQQARLIDRVARSSCPPLRSVSSAKSIMRMAFFFTMPISRMMPIIAMMLRSVRHSINASSAPTPAEGSVERIVIG